MEKEVIQTSLDLGKIIETTTDGKHIVIGKGSESLHRWLDSGPHGEAAQDSMDDGYFEEDFYDQY